MKGEPSDGKRNLAAEVVDRERSLKNDWESSGTLGREWEELKSLVRRAFDRARH